MLGQGGGVNDVQVKSRFDNIIRTGRWGGGRWVKGGKSRRVNVHTFINSCQ